MDQNNTNTETNTDIPVTIDTALTEALTPNAYLASLGITLEEREANVKQLARAVIKPTDVSGGFQTQIPFMVTKGPFIKEDFLTVNVSLKDVNGTAVIVLSPATELEEAAGTAVF
jgi:hypothetical protein